MEEKKVNYRKMAKDYIEYSSVELKQALIDKKGQEWVNTHWKALNKERADIMSKPPGDMRDRVANIKKRRTLGDDAGERVNDLEHSLGKVSQKMKHAIEIGQAVGGRVSEVKRNFAQQLSELKNELNNEREERKRLQKQLEKQQEQIEKLFKMVREGKKGEEQA